MKLCKKCEEVKSFTEFSKDKSKKDGLCAQCKSCRTKYVAGYYQENREEILENVNNYNIENSDQISIKNAQRYQENKEKVIKKVKKYRQKIKEINLENISLGIEAPIVPKKCYDCQSIKNSDEFHKDISRLDGFSNVCKSCTVIRIAGWQKNNPEKCNKNSAKYRKKHPDKHNATQAKRRAKKLNATPLWLTESQLKEIEEFYTLAQELQWLSEKPLHVDHIVPLQGQNVSGLHVPWNLQILPEPMNCSKSNKF